MNVVQRDKLHGRVVAEWRLDWLTGVGNLDSELAISRHVLLGLILEDDPVPRIVVDNASLARRVENPILKAAVGRGIKPFAEMYIGAVVGLAFLVFLVNEVDPGNITKVEILKHTGDALLRDVRKHTGDVEAQALVDRRRRHLDRRLVRLFIFTYKN